MKICFETFGCRLNRAEALQQEAEFTAAGWERTLSHEDADLIVVRGCSVTARAQRDCEKLIAHLREKYPQKRLVIEGCLEMRPTAAAGMPGADLMPPGAPRHQLRDGIQDLPVPTRTSRAYLKVQDGCSGRCAFCIVPKFRGRPVSVPFDEVLARAGKFVEAGYREIVVTGCNLSLYASAGRGLAELVAALAAVDPACRIRLGSIEPTANAGDVIHAVASSPNVCRHLHFAIQSGSNTILNLMRRPYHVHDLDRLLKMARALLPHAALGCDIITGFPGENELEFLATKGLLQRFAFSHIHAFPYSERPGTPAVMLGDVVPKNLRTKRAKLLSEMVAHQYSSFAKSFVGKTVEVIVEDEKHPGGWTGEYLWCSLAAADGETPDVKRKSRVRVNVTLAHHGLLAGVMI